MIEWRGDLLGNLKEIRAKAQSLDDEMEAGAQVVLAAALERTPKESGHLAESASILKSEGGNNEVGVVFGSVYARWIHEHLTFEHPRGGQAKFLESALLEKGHAAMNDAAERFWRRL